MLTCTPNLQDISGNATQYNLTLVAYNAVGTAGEYSTTYTPTNVQLALGDLDGDGAVTESDAFLAFLAAAGKMRLTQAQIAAADTDANGFITAADARFLYRRAAGLS